MRYLTAAALLSFVFHRTFAQVTFTVDNFSKDYFGKIFIADTSEVFSEGWIAVFDKKTKKQLIKVDSDELALSLYEGKALANIKELPYGEQSLIMYEDYNFDGKKDFAIEDGQNSCYHLPSFRIYLASPNGFKSNADFTELAQEYCGMFDVDYENKKLRTMTKSGCCWHQFSEFIVQDNKPKVVRIIVEDQQNFPYDIYSEEVWNGKKMVKTSKTTLNLDEEGIKTVLSFKIDKNQKKVLLFNINDRTLNYAFIDKDDAVEFFYPAEKIYQNPDFTYDPRHNTLTFKNKDATYTVHEEKENVSIEVIVGGKIYNRTGDVSTKEGTLSDLLTTKLDNVVIVK